MTDIDIRSNLLAVQGAMADACARSNRDLAAVTLVAVSKTKPVEAVLAAIEAGVQHFGENRVEEAADKIPNVNAQLTQRPVWHMIGNIQSRRAKMIVPLFNVVHSIDRYKIAHKLSTLAQAAGKKLPVLIEVNISGEDAKLGYEVSNWKTDQAVKDAFWQEMTSLLALPDLEIRGLMTMAPYYAKSEETRPIFAGLAELREALSVSFGVQLPDLSMGMTNDYSVAIEEGATIVRIGRAIFGSRD